MDDRIKAELDQEDPSPFHQKVLLDSRALIKISRDKMSTYYANWDRHDEVYRGVKQKRKEDIAAFDRDEPQKMVVPISYSQVNTFVAFCFSLYTQRDHLFELNGFTVEDERPAKIGEALLARDLNQNIFETKLEQFLLDIARFGIGVMKTQWVTETQMEKKTVVKGGKSVLGIQLTKPTSMEVEQEIIKYQGNRIDNISPYRFFPDVRLPLTRFQEGEFCASEELYPMSKLKRWEHEGMIAGVQWVKPMTNDNAVDRRFNWDISGTETLGSPIAGMVGDGQIKKPVVITEIQREMIPSEYMVEGEPLGPEDYPIKYVVWIANDKRIVKCEPMGYAHNQFTYSLAPFLFDNNQLISGGISESIDQLQSVITWFINSRITSVRKVISNYIVADPSGIHMEDLDKRRPVIRLKANAVGGIERYIKQLEVHDVTTHHIDDVKFLQELIQVVTGINDSLLGQFQTGRRSATEHRQVASGSAARLKTIASIVFRQALEQMGRQMLSNLRDGLDAEQYVRLLGQTQAIQNPEFIAVTKEDLIGQYDFEFFDGTLPSERQFTAQALMELVTAFMQNPEAAAAFQLDPRKLLMRALEYRGVKNPEQFSLAPPTTIPPNGQPSIAQPPNGPGAPAPGVPGLTPESILSSLAGGARPGPEQALSGVGNGRP